MKNRACVCTKWNAYTTSFSELQGRKILRQNSMEKIENSNGSLSFMGLLNSLLVEGTLLWSDLGIVTYMQLIDFMNKIGHHLNMSGMIWKAREQSVSAHAKWVTCLYALPWYTVGARWRIKSPFLSLQMFMVVGLYYL